jgi:hypothetical protein
MIQLKHLLTGILFTTSVAVSAQKTFECSGFKLEAEGKKISSYTQSGLDIEGYIAVRQDSIIYTEVKSKAGAIDRMFKYHLYIGDVEFNPTYIQLGCHDMKKGEKTLKHVSFYCAGRAQLCYKDEVFCTMNRTGAGKSAGLETYFDDLEEGKAFFADIQSRKEKMPPRSASGSAPAATTGKAKTGEKELDPGHPYVYFVNMTGHDIYVKVAGSSATKLYPKGKTSVSYSVNEGREFVETDKDNRKTLRTICTISKELAKKGEFLIQ